MTSNLTILNVYVQNYYLVNIGPYPKYNSIFHNDLFVFANVFNMQFNLCIELDFITYCPFEMTVTPDTCALM